MYGANCVILGGDITGKSLVPLCQVNSHWEGEVGGRPVTAADDDELQALVRKIADRGVVRAPVRRPTSARS